DLLFFDVFSTYKNIISSNQNQNALPTLNISSGAGLFSKSIKLLIQILIEFIEYQLLANQQFLSLQNQIFFGRL
ncbi:hypothetical protein J3U35_06590, partial [Gilliamella sp. B2717]|uniref:hypothetical protein n=1 Tax=Gilliamella sp. B2717 TaxID=2817996 RepID=UPI002269E6D6